MLVTELLLDIATVLPETGDVTITVRHNHQSYNIAANSIAIIRDEKGAITGVSFATNILPIGIE